MPATCGILAYGCSTSAGRGTEALWRGVSEGQVFLRDALDASREWPVPLTFEPKACLWPERGPDNDTPQLRLLSETLCAWREARSKTHPSELGSAIGVILATTKGFVETDIWSGERHSANVDVLSPLLNLFCQQAEISPVAATVVSNACASSLSALWLGARWLEAGRVETVIVVAVDGVGPFVLQGFQCLQALSAGPARPFAGDRDGLQLGEGAAVLILQSQSKPQSQSQTARASDFVLKGAAIDAEGYAVTRPSPSGQSLARAVRALSNYGVPDLIIAHGTGTKLNDQVEDQVFFEQYGLRPLISASKWSVGHTLGACGAIDVILACEAMRRSSAFRIASTPECDPKFHCRYLLKDSELDVVPSKVLVSSLGFGGIHAAAMIEKRAH